MAKLKNEILQLFASLEIAKTDIVLDTLCSSATQKSKMTSVFEECESRLASALVLEGLASSSQSLHDLGFDSVAESMVRTNDPLRCVMGPVYYSTRVCAAAADEASIPSILLVTGITKGIVDVYVSSTRLTSAESVAMATIDAFPDANSYLPKSKQAMERANTLMQEAQRKQASRPSSTPSQSTSSSGGCYVATAVYGSYDCPEVWTLRRFRDYTLAETWYGRAFVRCYYAISPTLVKWFGSDGWFKSGCRKLLDPMVANLKQQGYAGTPYIDKEW